MHTEPGEKRPISPARIFTRFLIISGTTPGGGYALIAVLGRDLARLKWMDHHEFTEVFALIQAVPGPVALNSAVVVGKKLGGIAGSILAVLGVLIPPFIMVLLANQLFVLLPEHPLLTGAIQGSYAVALGFVGGILVKVITTYRKSWYWILVSLAFAALMILVPSLFLLSFFSLIFLFYWLVQWKP